MSKVMNPVPIYHKIPPTIGQAADPSTIGINKTDAIPRKAFEAFSAKIYISDSASQILVVSFHYCLEKRVSL